MNGTLIAGSTVTHLGLFRSPATDETNAKLVAAGIIVKCELPADECDSCKYHHTYRDRFHMGEGFKYGDYRLASRRLFHEIRAREAQESADRVAAALGATS